MIPIKDIDLDDLITKMIDLRASGKHDMEEIETLNNAIIELSRKRDKTKPTAPVATESLSYDESP